MIADVVRPGVTRQRLVQQGAWLIAYSAVFFTGMMIAAFAYLRSYQPYIGISGALLLVLLGCWFFRPRLTLYATMFLALVGDVQTIGWFPFTKNLSSIESILYLSDALTISPLEIALMTGVAVTVMRGLAAGRGPFVTGAIGRPLILFTAVVLFGLARGLSLGGDPRIAAFEVRALFYIPILYFLVNTILTKERHLHILMIAASAGVFVQSLLSLQYLSQLDAVTREGLDTLTEHGSAIGHNMVILSAVAALALRRVDIRLRLAYLVMAVPVVMVYLQSQRRAGVVTIGVGVLLLAAILFWRQRRTFWKVVPIAALIIVGYLGAFWNSQSAIGFPAQAVKTVIAPGQLGEEDASSNAYRVGENLNVSVSIRSSPLFGFGFGVPFLRPYPLPSISDFVLDRYIPHNSFLWIWIKMGFVGMATTVYILGRAVMLGAARIRRMADGVDALMVTVATSVVVMYTLFTYVDIAWDARNMVLLGAVLSIACRPAPPDDGEAGGGSGDRAGARQQVDGAAPSPQRYEVAAATSERAQSANRSA